MSAKSLDRPALQAALERLHPKRRDMAGIVVAKLDRLSRSSYDFAGMLALARSRNWAIVAIDLGVDTSTITGKLVAQIMMAIAEWERELIGERTSAAMQAAKRQGKRISRTAAPIPSETAERMRVLRALGHGPAKIAATLNDEGVTTPFGSKWYQSTVASALARLTAA